MNRRVVFDGVADFDQAVGQPVAEAVAIEQRHHHIHVGLELDQAFAGVGDRALADSLELDAVVVLEGFGQGDEIIRVHLHRVRMARDS